MVFTERYKDLIKTEHQIEEQFNSDITIENNIIKELDIVVIGHFGCVVSVDMICDGICPLGLYNSTHNIGYILRALIEIFDKEDDNAVSVKKLAGTPIRIVFKKKLSLGSVPVAIGHFMKNRFVVIDELMKIIE